MSSYPREPEQVTQRQASPPDPNRALTVQFENVRALLEKQRAQIASVLPRNVTPDRMIRVFLTTLRRPPKPGQSSILECSAHSLLSCFMTAAQFNLELDPIANICYLVPFKQQATLLFGYRGLMIMAERSGRVRFLPPIIVREKDKYRMPTIQEGEMYSQWSYEPYAGEDAGKAVAYVSRAVIKIFSSENVDYRWMWRKEVDEHRARSKSPNMGPWVTDYDAMALKTVIRAHTKYLPVGHDLQDALTHDEDAMMDIEAAPSTAKKSGAAALLGAIGAPTLPEPPIEHAVETDEHGASKEVAQ